MEEGMNHWQGKRVLVTGAGGFIGSHLVEKLARSGALIRGFVHYNSRDDPGFLADLPFDIREAVEIFPGDLRDSQAVLAATREIEVVFHLGALISIPYSYIHPVEVVETNILGTLNLLIASRETGVQRIVHTSSSEVYGTARTIPIDEVHPLQGQSPYSASKIGADKLAESFNCTYDLPVVTIRPFNTYGPRQSARAVIPTIIAQALTQEVVYLGNLKAMRDLTFVDDTVSGLLLAGKVSGIEGRTINLGTGSEINIADLSMLIFSIIGSGKEIRVAPERLRPDRSEVGRLLSDNRLARKLLGWKPEVTLQDGLTQTINWIANHLHLYHPDRNQI
jgi:dTDP-glucose 4,6-dehydratase